MDRATLDQTALNGSGAPEALFATLAKSMFEVLPPTLRDFLLASSTLTRLTPELCSLALGLANTTTLLEEVQQRNLFLSKSSHGMVYHALFRDFLQGYLRRTQWLKFIDLHLKAANWYEQANSPEDAVDHYLSAQQSASAARLADRFAESLLVDGNTETLLGWAKALEQTESRSAQLLYRCAIIQTDQYRYTQADAALRDAEQLFQRASDDVGLTYVQIQRAQLELQQDQVPQA